jgi:transcriptional regulator with XRE-family HTH domain
MGRPRMLIASGDAALGSLIRWVHDRLDETGTTYEQVAGDVVYSRSWVSRALCGRRLPPWQVIEATAVRCRASTDEARRLWEAAGAAQSRRETRRRKATYPPSDIDSWQCMYDALGDLISRRVGSHRELARRDTSGRLTRSTIGAILRYERSLSHDVLDQVLIACGVSGIEREAWMDAWERYGGPRRDEMEELRRAIAYSRLQPRRFASYSAGAR